MRLPRGRTREHPARDERALPVGPDAVILALSQTRSSADVARVVVREMAAAIGADRALLAVPCHEQASLRLLDSAGQSAGRGARSASFACDADLPVSAAFRNRQPVWLSCREALLERHPDASLVGESRTEAVACVPLLVRGAAVGAVGFEFFRPRVFAEAERALIEELAGQAGQALERARLLEAEQTVHRDVELARAQVVLLGRLAELTGAAESLAELHEPVVEVLLRLFQVDGAAIARVDEDGAIRFTAARGIPGSWRRQAESHCPWPAAGIAAQPIFTADLRRNDPVVPCPQRLIETGVRSVALIPLLHRQQLLGQFVLSCRRGRLFTPAQRELCAAVAVSLAQAMGRLGLRADVGHSRAIAEQARQQVRAVCLVSDPALARLAPSVFVPELLGRVRRLLCSDAAALWLIDATGRELELVACDGRDCPAEPARLPLDEGLADDVLRSRQPVVDSASARRPGTACSQAGVPVLAGERLLGMLQVRATAPRCFTSEELQLLQLAAERLASAVIQSRLAARERAAAHLRELLARVTQAPPRAGSSAEALLRPVAESLASNCDGASVALVAADGDSLQPLAFVHPDPQAELLFRQLWSSAPVCTGEGICGGVIATGRSVLLALTPAQATALAPAALRAYYERFPVHGVLCVPLRLGDRLIGALEVSRCTRGSLSRDDLHLFQELADGIALVLDRARLHGEPAPGERDWQELLAAVIHDLRNPLGAILMAETALRLLQRDLDERAAPRVRRCTDIIRRSGERMTGILGDLHDLASLQAHCLIMMRRPIAPAEIVDAVVERSSAAAVEASVDLQGRSAPDLPPVDGDPDRLIQALSNLVSATVKATAPGGRVIVTAVRAEPEVHFCVQGSGPEPRMDEPPLPSRHQEGGDRPRYKGIGLGVAISYGIIEAHGGRIWVTDEPGATSRFHCALPLAAPGASQVSS